MARDTRGLFKIRVDTEKREVTDKLYNGPRKRNGFDSPILRMDTSLFNDKIAFMT